MRFAVATSSGVLTLKNGSTGVSGQSATPTPQRAAQSSTLRTFSLTSACRSFSRSATGHSADDGMAPAARLRAGERRAGVDARKVQARDQVAGQERAVARHAHDPGDVRRVARRPIEAGENAGQRAGIIRHAVGDHREAGRGETGWIAVGVENEPLALRLEPRQHVLERRRAADEDAGLVAAAHAAGEAARQHDAEGGAVGGLVALVQSRPASTRSTCAAVGVT